MSGNDRRGVNHCFFKSHTPPVNVQKCRLVQQEAARGLVVLEQHDVGQDLSEQPTGSGQAHGQFYERPVKVKNPLGRAETVANPFLDEAVFCDFLLSPWRVSDHAVESTLSQGLWKRTVVI